MASPAPANGNGNGMSRWLTVGSSAIAIAVPIGLLFWQVVSVAIETKANADRLSEFNDRLNKITAEFRTVEIEQTQLKASLAEIETQFCSTDIVRNLMHADDMRRFSLLWQKVYGERLPTDNSYYPVICNRKAAK
jgi:hypothetical protein